MGYMCLGHPVIWGEGGAVRVVSIQLFSFKGEKKQTVIVIFFGSAHEG